MAKYLDYEGLTAVVNNVKSLVDVLHITSVEDDCNTSNIRNTEASGSYKLVYVKNLKLFFKLYPVHADQSFFQYVYSEL